MIEGVGGLRNHVLAVATHHFLDDTQEVQERDKFALPVEIIRPQDLS
jgi:hypothetical protein